MNTNTFYKFFLVMILAICSTVKAQSVNTEWATKINQTFAGIDKNKVPHSLLRDYAMEFTNLAAYNGVLTDTSYVSKGTLTSIYNTLLMARVKTNVMGLVSPALFKQNWNNLRQKNTIVLSGLYYKYSQFKSNAYPNFVTVTNNTFYDKYVGSVWQNPYEEKQVFAITPPIIKYKGLKTTVKLPLTLWYTNQGTAVQSIAVDFDNGAGYIAIPFNTSYALQYTQEGVKNWKYKLTLTNGQILYSQSRIIFEGTLYDVPNTTLQRTINQPCSQNASGIDQVEFVGSQLYMGSKNTATLEIDYKDNDCKIKKPLIVAEGFESGLLGVENGLGDNDIKDFKEDALVNSGNLEYEIANYDIIYVNWDNGKDHLQRNAMLLEDIIQWVNQQKALNNSPEKNVVLGQSMGGVITRYALADMEQRSMVHETKLYISHDAPHQGANIPLGIQYFARHLADQFIGTPLGDFQFEVSNGSNASIDDISALLNATGTKQLLDNYITPSFSLDNSVNDAWQTDLLSKGYPTQTRNIAISNGSHCAKTQDYDYNASLFRMNGNARTGVLSDILGSLLGIGDDIALAIVFNEPALLVGILPGSSKFNLDFNAKALPSSNLSANIYSGKISFTKKLLWIANITINLTNRSYNNPVNLSFDKYAGGKYELFGKISDIALFDDNGDLTQFQADLLNLLASANVSFGVEKTFGFINTTSALDVGRGYVILNDTDYFRVYTALNPPTGNRAIPFQNFITAYENSNSLNERHISFNTRNGNWLASELDNNINNNIIFDCSYICTSTQISGANTVCATANYSVPTISGGTYNWTITEGANLVTFTGNGTSNIIVTKVGTGKVTMQVTFGNSTCGYLTLTKTIWVGLPAFVLSRGTTQSETCDTKYHYVPFIANLSPNTSLAFTYLYPSTTTYTQTGNTYTFRFLKAYSGYFDFMAVATNSCGNYYADSEGEHFIGTCTSIAVQNKSSVLDTTDLYKVYPNPTNDILNIDLVDENFMPETKSQIIAELYNMMGELKGNVQIFNTIASINVKGLPKGIYVLKINIDGQIENHQVAIE